MSDTKPQLTPGRILGVLAQNWYVLLLAGVVGAVGAFLYSSTIPPVFHSTASIYFSMRTGTSGSDINQGSAYTQNQMLSFAQLSMSSLVLDEVREDLDTDLTNAQIRRLTTVVIPQNTVILEITAGSTNPEFAAELANSVSENLAIVVDEIAPRDDADNSTVVARVIEPGEPATVQSSPNKTRDAAVGGVAGVLLAGLALAVWALLDTRVRSEAVLRRLTELPVLGAIPLRRDKSRRPVVISEPNGASAEAYRQVRSSLRFAAVEHQISAIAVTSSVPGEGKTTAAVNLALTYAEAGLRVLLVDTDLRRPMVAESLGLENSVGLTTLLVGAVDFDDAKLPWGESTLWVLPAGEVPPNPAELLASSRMSDVLAFLRTKYDMMIVDTAPLLSVADATIIAQHVDATIVVADVTKVRLAQLERSLSSLTAVRAQIAGVLLSRVRAARRDAYYYSVNRTDATSKATAKGAVKLGKKSGQQSDSWSIDSADGLHSGERAELRREATSEASRVGAPAVIDAVIDDETLFPVPPGDTEIDRSFDDIDEDEDEERALDDDGAGDQPQDEDESADNGLGAPRRLPRKKAPPRYASDATSIT